MLDGIAVHDRYDYIDLWYGIVVFDVADSVCGILGNL